MKKYKSFLFDLNGTMIDDMQYHFKAWYGILNEFGADISKEGVKEQCYGKNQELLERIFPGRFTEKEKDKISIEKERQYQIEFRPHLKLMIGLDRFLKTSYATGIKMAIGSSAITFNIDFVLDSLGIRKYFDVIVSADDVKQSKPDRETWIKCAEKMDVNPSDCLVFEDSPKGAESALNAGIECIIITKVHEQSEFRNYKNVIGFINDFEDTLIETLIKNY